MLNFLVFALIIALAAQGWNILGGFGGQFSFGHAAFFGTGAYATAILQVRFGVNAWVGLRARRRGRRAGRLRSSAICQLPLRAARLLFRAGDAGLRRGVPDPRQRRRVTGGAAGMLIRLDVRPANFQFASRGAFFWIALGAGRAGRAV